ncbi:MAG: FKBP-type peptidyl-prolyl cis-trans isomerase [Saprospiraceae bacterium]|nr:FKBP-type peptidyl-prolyl cis-trans isomerase [Saprospiraceae bacterium]
MRSLLILISASLLLLSSCKKSQLECDIEDIQDYLKSHNLTAKSTDTGLHYIITTEGTGASPTVANKVTVRYKGYLLDGTVFDQTQGSSTASFPLANVIQGWQEAIPYLKKGGKGTFFIPSEYGYGGQAQPGIPAWSVLIFEVELVSFQ